MTLSSLSSALRRTAARSLRRDVAALGGHRPWIRAAAAASSRFFCSAQEAVEPSGTPEGDGEFPGTSGRVGADALAGSERARREAVAAAAALLASGTPDGPPRMLRAVD